MIELILDEIKDTNELVFLLILKIYKMGPGSVK